MRTILPPSLRQNSLEEDEEWRFDVGSRSTSQSRPISEVVEESIMISKAVVLVIFIILTIAGNVL